MTLHVKSSGANGAVHSSMTQTKNQTEAKARRQDKRTTRHARKGNTKKEQSKGAHSHSEKGEGDHTRKQANGINQRERTDPAVVVLAIVVVM